MSCPRCETEAKVKVRTFSDQAVAALIIWGEIDKQIIDKPLCQDCYDDLRDTLIERESEIEKTAESKVIQAS